MVIQPPQSSKPPSHSDHVPDDQAFCTVVSKNHLACARTLCRSVLRCHPGARFFVLLVDRVDGYFDPAGEPFELILADDLGNIPERNHLFFKYDVLELNCALKPYLLEHLFVRYSLKKLVYFDSDILVFSRLEQILDELDRATVILTPHLTSPLEDSHHPGELDILLAGTFNLGFLAMSWTGDAPRLLKWWQARVHRRCELAPAEGVLLDQKWMELAPSLFDRVQILREPLYNIAYWNCHERAPGLQFLDGQLTMHGRSAGFFHFSGLNPRNIEQVSMHQTRYTLNDLPHLRPLFEHYRDRLYDEGYPTSSRWPYAYSRFDNGATIPVAARTLYRSLGQEALRFGDPFKTAGSHSFFSWLNQPVGKTPADTQQENISRLHREIYQCNPDLRQRFPDGLGVDRSALWNWLKTDGMGVYQLSDDFFPTTYQSVPEAPSRKLLRVIKRIFQNKHMLNAHNTIGAMLRRLLKPYPRLLAWIRALDERLF